MSQFRNFSQSELESISSIRSHKETSQKKKKKKKKNKNTI